MDDAFGSTYTLRIQRRGRGCFGHVALVIRPRSDRQGRVVVERYHEAGSSRFGETAGPIPQEWQEGVLRGLRAAMALMPEPEDITIDVVEAVGTTVDTTPTAMAYAACMALLTAFHADTPDIVRWLDRVLDDSRSLPYDHLPVSGPMK